MKIEAHPEAPPPRSSRDAPRFHEALERGSAPPASPGPRPPVPPVRAVPGVRAIAGPPRQVVSPGALAPGEHLRQVRQGASAEVHRLQGVRGEAHQTAREHVHHRLTELLTRELARESAVLRAAPRETGGGRGGEPLAPEPGEPCRPPVESRAQVGAGTGAALAAPPTPETRAQALLSLIEKIEVLVRAQRPALAMRVGGALDATVEVERTGVREVALRIQGHRAPLRAEDVARLKAALTARGLTLRALSST